MVLGKHVDAFRDFKVLFGDDESLDVSTRFYQRLLAGDKDQAKLIAKQSKESHEHIGLLDTIVVPILRRTRRDRESGRLSREDELTLTESLRHILEELQPIDKHQLIEGLPQSIKALEGSMIVAIPSHHAFEEMILYQMAIELGRHCELLQIASTRTLPSALEMQFEQMPPDVVIVCVIPPGGLLQAEYLCNRIHMVSPRTKVLVTFFGKTRNFDRLLVRFRKAGAGYVATSVEQTLQYVTSWMESGLSKNIPER